MSMKMHITAADEIHPRVKVGKHEIIIEEVGCELVVYDLENRKCHTLNETATIIWQKCDGYTSVSDIAGEIKAQSGLNEKQAEEVVWYCLDKLQKSRLMESPIGIKIQSPRSLTRRRLLQRVGGVLVLPVIASILAPTPAHAVSCAICRYKICPPSSPVKCAVITGTKLDCKCKNSSGDCSANGTPCYF